MPFDNEFATGESLDSLQRSPAFKDFKGTIRTRHGVAPDLPRKLAPVRNEWRPQRVIAIDGSTVTAPVQNGFPIAEASLMKVAVLSIDIAALLDSPADAIPHPAIFYEMEKASTFDSVLPGANIVREGVTEDTPRRFFRHSVAQVFEGKLDQGFETLMETARNIVGARSVSRPPMCPVEDCIEPLSLGLNEYTCRCSRAEKLFETDAFRFSERFNDVASNGEAHGEVRHVVEVISLFNMLRFFASDKKGLSYLKSNVFVLDGPLALFGHPAWLAPYLRAELQRINGLCLEHGFELAVFGFEKSGAFVEHFEQLDHDPQSGPRARFEPGTVFSLDADYINRNITMRPPGSKPHGQDTYFGRKLFYKTRAGEHAVITTAMTNNASLDFGRCDAACYTRLGDVLNVLDVLATYLYRDGFMPLVRANAHAAIPLKRGSDLIQGLFGKGAPMVGVSS